VDAEHYYGMRHEIYLSNPVASARVVRQSDTEDYSREHLGIVWNEEGAAEFEIRPVHHENVTEDIHGRAYGVL